MSHNRTRDDMHQAWATAQRSQERLARVERESSGTGFDPTCRFARTYMAHICERSDGRPVEPGTPCALEARAQVAEQADLSRCTACGQRLPNGELHTVGTCPAFHEQVETVEPDPIRYGEGGPEYKWVQ